MTVPTGWCMIVEGEPGIFPAPIAGGLVRLNRWVRRRLGRAPDRDDDAGKSGSSPTEPAGPPDPPAQ
ncbi:MAG: hypothetical protein M3P85_07470 [Actinomycetota bacterium]|nr:hypothetical protein [Actinomycetota bacterium]